MFNRYKNKWQNRLDKELYDLGIKQIKLRQYIDNYGDTDNLLELQYYAMELYHKVLDKRLELCNADMVHKDQ